LAWYVLWLYVINDNQFRSLNRDIILFGGSNNSRYPLGKPEVSLTRSIVSDIPWKSLFTSVPVLVIVLLYICIDRVFYKRVESDFYIDVCNCLFNTFKNHHILLLTKSILNTLFCLHRKCLNGKLEHLRSLY